MIDEYGRSINYLRVSVTDRCNLRCVYCLPESGIKTIEESKLLSIEEIYRIIKIGVDLCISKVRFTGGEPLVREGIVDLIKRVKGIEGIKKVCLTTNGILLEENIAKLADAGLDNINISLDTLKEDRYREMTRGGDLKKILRVISEAERKIPEVKINSVVLKDINEDEILNLIYLTKDLKIDLRFIELMPIGHGKSFKGISNEEIKSFIKEHERLQSIEVDNSISGPAVYYKVPSWKGKIGFISPISHNFCSSCNRARLTCEGFFKQCLHWNSGVDLKKLIRSEITEDSLRSVMEKWIFEKPEKHDFLSNSNDKENKGMSQIGG